MTQTQTKAKAPSAILLQISQQLSMYTYKPQTNTELHCIPKTKYIFQGHCIPCWDWSQQGWSIGLHCVHKGTRSEKPIQMFVGLNYLDVSHTDSFANGTRTWIHGFDTTETSVLQRCHLNESLMSQMHSQAPGRGQGILTAIVLHTWFKS